MTTIEPTAPAELVLTVRKGAASDVYLKEDNDRGRVFLADTATIIYKREYDADGPDGEEAPTEIIATVVGRLITSGVPGKHQARRTYYVDDHNLDGIPSWLTDLIDQYRPTKRP